MTPKNRASAAPSRDSAASAPASVDQSRRRLLIAAAAGGLALAAPMLVAGDAKAAESADVINLRVDHSLERLKQTVPGAAELLSRAKGVLIIPGITKAGLFLGGAYGEGALRLNGMSVGYYSMITASFGLQAGVQKLDQALFFMTTAALESFRRSSGWELGADAEFVTPGTDLRDLSASLSTTTAQNPVIVLSYGQNGLMAGVSLEGGKYTKLKEKRRKTE